MKLICDGEVLRLGELIRGGLNGEVLMLGVVFRGGISGEVRMIAEIPISHTNVVRELRKRCQTIPIPNWHNRIKSLALLIYISILISDL